MLIMNALYMLIARFQKTCERDLYDDKFINIVNYILAQSTMYHIIYFSLSLPLTYYSIAALTQVGSAKMLCIPFGIGLFR